MLSRPFARWLTQDLGLTLLLAGCATYQPLPLPQAVPELTAQHVIKAPLTMAALVRLAVAQSRQLQVARDQARVAQAQAYAAGLLPDPQLAVSVDHPTPADALLVNAFNLGASFDLTDLMSRPLEVQGVQAAARQAELDLLWQTWQVISRARTLFVTAHYQQAQIQILERELELWQARVTREQQALAAGNLMRDALVADLAALTDARQNLADLELQANATRNDLATLVGLAVSAEIKLAGQKTWPSGPHPAAIRQALVDLPHRRPDLAALQAGYESQEAKLRVEVLRQFPALSVGLSRARDTSAIYTTGLSMTINLPLFNRNRGNIAIAKATRQQLYDEYIQRLMDAQREVHAIIADQTVRKRALAQLQATFPQLKITADRAQQALNAGLLDELAYITLRQTALNQELRILRLQSDLEQQRIALATLLGPLANKVKS